MLEKFKERRKRRVEAVQKARDEYVAFLGIERSLGFKVFQERIDKKIEKFKQKFESDTTLTGDDLKTLQLGLQVYKEVKRIPQELKEDAKGGKTNENA